MIILASSNDQGTCFIQTGSLDGEKTLKTRKIPKDLNKLITQNDMHTSSIRKLSSDKTVVENEAPGQDLYSFVGKLMIDEKQFMLDSNQFLLMGANLKNTDWVLGFVVFTGNDTRLMQNSEGGKTKMSTLEKKLNSYVIAIFLVQIVISAVCAILSSNWYNTA